MCGARSWMPNVEAAEDAPSATANEKTEASRPPNMDNGNNTTGDRSSKSSDFYDHWSVTRKRTWNGGEKMITVEVAAEIRSSHRNVI